MVWLIHDWYMINTCLIHAQWMIYKWFRFTHECPVLIRPLPLPCSQKEQRVSELRNQLVERQALRNRRRPSSGTNQNHSNPSPPSSQPDPKSLLPPPGYPNPASDNHSSLPPSFSNSSNLYQADSKISRNHCHNSQIPLLYKWRGGGWGARRAQSLQRNEHTWRQCDFHLLWEKSTSYWHWQSEWRHTNPR